MKKINKETPTSYPNYSKPFRGLPPEIRLEIWGHLALNLTIIDQGAKKLAEATKTPPEDRYAFDHKLRRYEEKYCTKPWIPTQSPHVNLLLVNKQVNEEYRSSLAKPDITLNLLYVHLWPGPIGFSLNNGAAGWVHRGVATVGDLVLTQLAGNFSFEDSCARVAMINYRPFRDKEGRYSVCQLLKYIASDEGSKQFPSVRTVNYMIDYRDIIRFKFDHEEWNRKENGGRWYTASRPSWYWVRGLSITPSHSSRGRNGIQQAGERLDSQYYLDALIVDGYIDRFEIQLLNVPDHQKHLVNVEPFEPDLASSPLKDRLVMEVRWEYIGTKRWNGYLSLRKRRHSQLGGDATDQQMED